MTRPIRKLCALPLTVERFAPFGEVLEATADRREAMNSGRFERFPDLARIDTATAGGRPALSIARCRTPSRLPLRIDMLERHPHGSQVFMPLSGFAFFVVVAPAGDGINVDELAAFVSNGRQGINYRKGVWHMPMIALEKRQEFLIVERAGDGTNCDEHFLDEPVLLES